MNILYIITQKEGQTEAANKTIASLDPTSDYIHVGYSEETSEEEAINIAIEQTLEAKGYTHVCIIPAGSTTSSKYKTITEAYVKDEKAIYLPIVSYCFEEGSSEEVFKGFLNTIMWKAHIARELGVLTLDLSIKQADTTLYGALIPIKLLKENQLNKDIKYFSQFEYLNRIIKAEVLVLGIPKMIFTLNKDFELKLIPKEEKIKYFEQAREGYISKTI